MNTFQQQQPGGLFNMNQNQSQRQNQFENAQPGMLAMQPGMQQQPAQNGGQQQQHITKETKVKDLPQDVKNKIYALSQAIDAEDKQSAEVEQRLRAAEMVKDNREPRDMQTLIHDCGKLNKSMRYMNLRLENEVQNFGHTLEDLKQRVKSDYQCVERTHHKLDCIEQGTPQPLDLPSNYFIQYVQRSEEWLQSLEQQLEDLEHVFLSEMEDVNELSGGNNSQGSSSMGNFTADIWSRSLLNSSVPYNSYTSRNSSLSGSRSQHGTNNGLQLAVAESKQKQRPLYALEPSNAKTGHRPRRKDPYEVIKQTIRTQHAAVLQLAGDTVSMAHDNVERMKRSLLDIYRHLGDLTYDPFKEADEKLQEEEEYRKQ